MVLQNFETAQTEKEANLFVQRQPQIRENVWPESDRISKNSQKGCALVVKEDLTLIPKLVFVTSLKQTAHYPIYLPRPDGPITKSTKR